MDEQQKFYVKLYGEVCLQPLTQPLGISEEDALRYRLTNKRRQLLTLLAVNAVFRPNTPISHEEAKETLWPDKFHDTAHVYDESLKGSLTSLISELRFILRSHFKIDHKESHPIISDKYSRTLTLNINLIAIDAIKIQELFKEAQECLEPSKKIKLFECAYNYCRHNVVDEFTRKISGGYFSRLLSERQFQVQCALAKCYFNIGNTTDALVLIKSALEIKPDSEEAQNIFNSIEETFACRVFNNTSPVINDSIDIVNVKTLDNEEVSKFKPQSTNKFLNSLPYYSTSFIGREKDTDEVCNLVRKERLITIIGPGGSGKTRIAAEVARLMQEEVANIWWVELDTASEKDSILNAIATEVCMDSTSLITEKSLRDYLRPSKGLLIFDNCEHLIDECAAIAKTFLMYSPYVKILATSRRPLDIDDEQPYPLGVLFLPADTRALKASELVEYDATRLFIERIKKPYVATDSDAPLIASLCRSLDCLPLTIELTAARVGRFSPKEIIDIFDTTLSSLPTTFRDKPARHKSLDAIVAWSYKLLSDEHQAIFRQFSVFAGGGTVEAFQAIYFDGSAQKEQIHTLLDDLVSDSLIYYKGQNETHRYYMLDTLRQYGRKRLKDSGEKQSTLLRHLDYFASMAVEVNAILRGPEQARHFDKFDAEYPNILAALDWGISALNDSSGEGSEIVTGNSESIFRMNDQPKIRVIQMLADLGQFFRIRGHTAEVSKYYDRVITVIGITPALQDAILVETRIPFYEEETIDRHLAYSSIGLDIAFQMSAQTQETSTDNAVISDKDWLRKFAAFDQLNPTLLARLLIEAGATALLKGDHAEGMRRLDLALAVSRNAGDQYNTATALHYLARALGTQSSLEVRRDYCHESLTIWRALNNSNGIAEALRSLGYVELHARNAAQAQVAFEECLELYRQIKDEGQVSLLLLDLGHCLREQGKYQGAFNRYSEGLALLKSQNHAHGIAHALHNLGYVYRELGEYPKSCAHYSEAINSFIVSGEKEGIGFCLIGFARLFVDCGLYAEAVRFSEATLTFYNRQEIEVPLDYKDEFQATRDKAIANVTHEESRLLLASGVELSEQEYVSQAALAMQSFQSRGLLPQTAKSIDEGKADFITAKLKYSSLDFVDTSYPLRGREKELDHIVSLVEPHIGVNIGSAKSKQKRLVTLHGYPGVGKTRLALEVLNRANTMYIGAVCYVALEEVDEPQRLLTHISYELHKSHSLISTNYEQLVSNLSKAPFLLFLDNFEHLVDKGKKCIVDLLNDCPSLICLVTSQRLLDLDLEEGYSVLPLPLPAISLATDIPKLEENHLCQIFLDRVRRRMPNFVVEGETAKEIIFLCRQLDGLPLAIDLATPYMAFFPLSKIIQGIAKSIDFLESSRTSLSSKQRSLRATFQWSYELLKNHGFGDRLPTFFRGLSVFRGGCTFEAIQFISETEQAHPLLLALLERSLITSQNLVSYQRFGMLKTLHMYALELLNPLEREALARRHAEFFSKLAQEAACHYYDNEQQQWLDRLDRDIDNLVAALNWCLQDGESLNRGLGIACSLARYWWLRSRLEEGLHYLTAFLDKTAQEGNNDLRAEAFCGAGSLAYLMGDANRSHNYYEQSLLLAEAAHNKPILFTAYQGQGVLFLTTCNWPDARKGFEQSLEAAKESKRDQHIAMALGKLGELAWGQGENTEASAFFRESLAIQQKTRNQHGIASDNYMLGLVAIAQGDYVSARHYNEAAAQIDEELGVPGGIAYGMLGLLSLLEGDFEEAENIFDSHLIRLKATGGKYSISIAYQHLGKLHFALGEYPVALENFANSISLARTTKSQRRLLSLLNDFGNVAAAQKYPERAAKLWGAAQALRDSTGSGMPLYESKQLDFYMKQVLNALGEIIFAEWMALGRLLNAEQAVEYALSYSDTDQ